MRSFAFRFRTAGKDLLHVDGGLAQRLLLHIRSVDAHTPYYLLHFKNQAIDGCVPHLVDSELDDQSGRE